MIACFDERNWETVKNSVSKVYAISICAVFLLAIDHLNAVDVVILSPVSDTLSGLQ